MLGIALALISAAISALSVILVRRNSDQSNAFNVSLVVTCVGLIFLWPLASLTSIGTISFESLLLFAISGILSPGLVRLFYYRGLKTLGASINSSVFSIYPLFSALLAVAMLSESPSSTNWIGVLIIILGIISVEFSMTTENGESDRGKKSLIFPVLGGITLGIGSVVRKFALNLCNNPILGVAIAYVTSLLPYMIIMLLSVQTRKQFFFKRDLRFFWLAGIGQVAAWILAFYALSYETVSIATPLLSLEPLFVVLFAFFYLRKVEHLSAKLFAGILLTVFGVILVSL